MSFKIIGDSCCDMPEFYRRNPHFSFVPLTIHLGEESFIDDESFDQLSFIRKVAESTECPRTSCPSPQAYADAYDCDAEDIYVITLSERLSGSYNSAIVGRDLYLEDHPHKNIYVVNSCSAAGGEGLLALKIYEQASEGMKFADVVRGVEAYKGTMHTYFVLDTLETLRRNGRLSNVTAIIANALNIKPIMIGTREGEIEKLSQVRGIEKAVTKMCETAIAEAADPQQKTVYITQINCPERAERAADIFRAHGGFRDIQVISGAGISTVYANDGGIIVTL